ncbi:hypothetical protein B0H15DRAFT_945905 [Mycena belliarum]|uniref:Uncharacterized protein n=1 Tax=Mycena belliarum TaxID=1033014 RepID=A0AAD6UBJ1_9AGAR|nr:hypothetical protein B0H15DRAFT_945905 [Mycena belliae]
MSFKLSTTATAPPADLQKGEYDNLLDDMLMFAISYDKQSHFEPQKSYKDPANICIYDLQHVDYSDIPTLEVVVEVVVEEGQDSSYFYPAIRSKL